MDVTVAGITGSIQWDGFRKGRASDGPYVVIPYLVPYASADAFADGVMGGFSGSGGTIKIIPRQNCPTNPILYALSADITYVGETYPNGGSYTDIFKKAVVTVNYGLLTWPQFASDDPGGQQSFPNEAAPGSPLILMECEIDYASEVITVPYGSMAFVSDGHMVDVPTTKRVALDTYRIIRHNYPNLPTALVDKYRNKLNNLTFLGKSRGRVLFDGAKTKQVMTSDGTRCQGFEMTFLVRGVDWNEYPRPDDGTFDTIAAVTDSTKTPYAYDDLSPLLQ